MSKSYIKRISVIPNYHPPLPHFYMNKTPNNSSDKYRVDYQFLFPVEKFGQNNSLSMLASIFTLFYFTDPIQPEIIQFSSKMSSKIMQPTGIIKQTNVAFIKYKLDNKKFEIACYKNKAIDWRKGVEKDLQEVLQTDKIFLNAVHGTLANKKDLQSYFPNMTNEEIIKLILDKGELQVGEKERDSQFTNVQNDIINVISEKCCHPVSYRPFSVDSIKQAIKDIQFPIKIEKSAKAQATLCIKMLQEKYEITRAKMKLMVSFTDQDQETALLYLESTEITPDKIIKTENKNGAIQITVEIEPHQYRVLTEMVKNKCPTAGIEILEQNIIKKETVSLEDAGTVELKVKEDWIQKNYKTGHRNRDDNQDQEYENNLQQEREFEDFNQHNQQNTKKKIEEEEEEQKQDGVQLLPQVQVELQPGQKKCTFCQEAIFENVNDFRSHYKTDWHIYNVKRKSSKLKTVNEQEYLTIMLDESFR